MPMGLEVKMDSFASHLNDLATGISLGSMLTALHKGDDEAAVAQARKLTTEQLDGVDRFCDWFQRRLADGAFTPDGRRG